MPNTEALIARCLQCNSEPIVALTYISIDGQPYQAGVCEAHVKTFRYVDGISRTGVL